VLGMAPLGAFQAGWVSEHYGARVSFALGGMACVLMAALVGYAVRRERLRGVQRGQEPVSQVSVAGGEGPSPSLRSGSG
jgi:hypothetical protein